MDKLPGLKSNWLNYEILITSHKLQLARESIKNIFSISKFKGRDKEFNSLFKNIFGFSSPNISNVNYTDKYTVLWVRNNCYFVLSDTKSTEIQYKNLLSIFENNPAPETEYKKTNIIRQIWGIMTPRVSKERKNENLENHCVSKLLILFPTV